MGLFSHHPKAEVPKKQPLPRLPDFPEMPRPPLEEEKRSLPEFPSYEPTIRDIKQEVSGASRSTPAPVAIPARVPLQRPTIAAPRPITLSAVTRPSFSGTPTAVPSSSRGEEKPLFVRIDDYKVALDALHSLKEKIKEAEALLSSVSELRQKEEQHLQKWQQELQTLKSKLLTIDHTLFEV